MQLVVFATSVIIGSDFQVRKLHDVVFADKQVGRVLGISRIP